MNGSIAHSATTTTTTTTTAAAAAVATNDQSATAAVTNHDATTKESFAGEEQRELKQELPTVTSTTTAAATQTSTAGAGTIATGTTASKIPSCIQDGWFSEVEPTWPGQKLSLALEGFSTDSILYNEKSEFQSILVFRSAQHGNVMVLDGVVQLTENDEFVYQEMISHLPLMAHKNPKNVLIVGGGDGAVLREVCRHKTVQSITLVEIDQKVIEVAKKFFTTTTATTFDDPRVTIVHQDAAEFLEKQNASDRKGYDVIIADSSDPVGPAESLFDPAFYEQMYEALDDGGIICTQGDCFWTHPELIENVVACCADIFDAVEYATTYVPTYPCGQIGFIVAGKGEGMNLTKPARKMDAKLAEEMEWYTEEIHSASFVLPKFLEEKIAELRPQYKDEEDEDEEEEDGMKGDCFLQRCVIS